MGSFSTYGRNQLLGGMPNTVYAQAHSGNPGAAGTLNALAGVARIAVPLAPAANGVRAPSAGTYQFDILAGQTIAWVTYWDANANGNFLSEDQLDQAEAFAGNGRYTLTVQDFTVT